MFLFFSLTRSRGGVDASFQAHSWLQCFRACYTCTRLLHVTARITIRLSIYLLCRIPAIFNAVLFFEHVHLMLIGYIHPVHRWRFRCYFSCNVCALGDARWEGEGGSGTMFLCV